MSKENTLLSKDTLLSLYKQSVELRSIEEKLLVAVKSNKIAHHEIGILMNLGK